MTRIAILQHHRQKVDKMLLIHYLADIWRNRGLEVTFYNGINKRIEGGILIPQVDLTVIPEDYVEVIEQFEGLVINKGIYDISKRRISRQLVADEPGFSGEAIVKPNLNSNGYPELRLKSKWAKGIYLTRKLMSMEPETYEVYSNVDEVPNFFKNSKDYIVEKFLPQREGDEYIIGLTTFLGDTHCTLELRSKYPVMRGSDPVSRRVIDTPDEVREEQQRLVFDYGKFEYVIAGGEVILFDANKTIGGSHAFAFPDMIEMLANGIYTFLEKG